ncbi:GNAT family N-acetyltransferase [Mangrovimonas sp. YM274]|uniref:GNAT family N-acetyltransferase n=1 Tax=Mangrovimonas sp. YM274 TaxID=3070660 RepID=UPI0027DAB86A|nr:GNAT family N-acetyltransferase [Mangrovimonas sp. YM274]WMI68859.1 GNAT family N-acetyltransferase [Mangrovimonas sp. YM274]
MVLSKDTFELATLQHEDAPSLSQLMITNGRRFQLYLPKTLAQNISEEASVNYIAQQREAIIEQTEYTFAIKDLETSKVAGLVILKNLNWNQNQGEFAYCLGNNYTGNGWMVKALKTSIQFAFNDLALQTLNILVHKTNTPSVNVAKRCGFSWVKTLENDYISSAKGPLDMELYQLHNER